MTFASDREQVSQEPHELKHILKKYGKRQTQDNQDKLSQMLKDFKADPANKPHLRKEFYEYLDKGKLGKLESS